MSLTDEKPRAKFTPGPWVRLKDEVGTQQWGKLARVCLEDGDYATSRERLDRVEPNSRLIGEAPAMFRLLECFVDGVCDLTTLVNEARSIIERVHGD